MELESDKDIQIGKTYQKICLGVLGKREDIQKTDLIEKIMHPLMKSIGKLPDIVYLSTEGISTAHIGNWAERCEIPFENIHADCRKLGRKAFALRDGRILKASTHLLIFEQPKSEYIVKLGIREFKKGKPVFSVTSGKQWELQEWETETQCKLD
jgi:hypothetical protein